MRSFQRRPLRQLGGASWLAVGAALFAPSAAMAHGFGERYDPAFPLAFYAAAIAAVTLLSAPALWTMALSREGARAKMLIRMPIPSSVAPLSAALARWLSASALVVLIVAGLFGTPVPALSITSLAVWAGIWMLLFYTCVLLGNLWHLLNPWDALFRGLERVYARLDPGAGLSLGLRYAHAAGSWPAFALLLGLLWLEAAHTGASDPRLLAGVLLAFSALTLGGMFLFGREEWTQRADPLQLLFSSVSVLAPVSFGRSLARGNGTKGALRLRFPGAELLQGRRTLENEQAAAITALLAALMFGEFAESRAWPTLLGSLGGGLDPDSLLIRTAGLAAFMIGVGSALLAVSNALSLLLDVWEDPAPVARHLAAALAPVAVAYHFVSTLPDLLVRGGFLIPALGELPVTGRIFPSAG
ncbi:MAG: hypothetical protein ACOC5K_03795, partial [Chloroflexota bacterium]